MTFLPNPEPKRRAEIRPSPSIRARSNAFPLDAFLLNFSSPICLELPLLPTPSPKLTHPQSTMVEVLWILMRLVAVLAAGILSYLFYYVGRSVYLQYKRDGTTPFGRRRWRPNRTLGREYQSVPTETRFDEEEEPSYHDLPSPRPDLQVHKPLPERPLPDKPLPPVPGE